MRAGICGLHGEMPAMRLVQQHGRRGHYRWIGGREEHPARPERSLRAAPPDRGQCAGGRTDPRSAGRIRACARGRARPRFDRAGGRRSGHRKIHADAPGGARNGEPAAGALHFRRGIGTPDQNAGGAHQPDKGVSRRSVPGHRDQPGYDLRTHRMQSSQTW